MMRRLSILVLWMAALPLMAQQIRTVSQVASGLSAPYAIRLVNGEMLVSVTDEIIKIKANGETETVAEAAGGALEFVPYGNGYVVMETDTHSVVLVDGDGNRTTLTDELLQPVEIEQWGDHFIVTDFGALDQGIPSRVVSVSLDGEVNTIADGPFLGVGGLAVVGDVFYATDFFTSSLWAITPEGDVSVVAQGLGFPVGLAFDGRDFIVADNGQSFLGETNGRVLRVSLDGEVRDLTYRIHAGNPSTLALQGPDVIYTDIVAGTITRLEGYRINSIFPMFKQ